MITLPQFLTMNKINSMKTHNLFGAIFCLAALLVTQHPQRQGLYECDSRN